jgi:RNA polymerase sigma factor (sigma-70 family)
MSPISAHPVASNADAHAQDMRLLRRYVELGSQDAFAEIVRKHLPWIYSSCRRALRDPHLAEDAAQAVFIVLARRAESITPETRLAGWLFNTARFVVKDAKKARSRYLRREEIAKQVAAERNGNGRNGFQGRNGNGNGNGVHLGGGLDSTQQAALDDGLATLSERDRYALIMHFYEGLTLQQMAAALGIGKEGAKKRVGRALSRLRQKLGVKVKARGNGRAALSIIALALLLRSQSAWAVPAGLARRTIESAAGAGVGLGIGGGLAPWLADWALGASARASGRLFRAALAAEILAAVAVTTVALWPARSGLKVALDTPQGSRAGDIAQENDPGTPQWTLRSGGSGSSGASESEGPLLVTTSEEPPYRSGANDPEPKPLEPAPKPVAAAPAAGGGAVKVEAPAEEPGPVAGSSYAGVPPVARAVSPEVVYEPPPAGPVKVEMPQPPLPFGALGTGGEGPRATKRSKDAVATPRPHSPGTGTVPPGMVPDGSIAQDDAGQVMQVSSVGGETVMGAATGTELGSVVPPADPAMTNPNQLPPSAIPAEGNAFATPARTAAVEPAVSREPQPAPNVTGRPTEVASNEGNARGPMKVRRSFDSDDARNREIKSKPGAVVNAGKRPPWMKRERPVEVDDREGPLTLIGGKPIPVNVLENSGRGPAGGDRPSYVDGGSWHGHWGGRPGGVDGAVYQQVPEPSAVMWVGVGALLLGRRRRARR